MDKFYRVTKKSHPWGDYYSILMHGMSCHLGRDGGRIQLERTGPFIPPFSLPGIGDIVVTDAFRRKLEASGLLGLRFQPVIKKLIARSEWHTWDRQASKPTEYPDEGEPEGYILDESHCAATAKEMGDLWEVLLNQSARIHRVEIDFITSEIFLLPDSWQGEDLFGAQGVRYIFATERARAFLEKDAGDYLMFKDVQLKGGN
jgi:hypothetical protein